MEKDFAEKEESVKMEVDSETPDKTKEEQNKFMSQKKNKRGAATFSTGGPATLVAEPLCVFSPLYSLNSQLGP